MLLEFQERMIMAEEWWSFVQRGGTVWVTHFKHRSFHKYTRVARDQNSVEIKSMIDLVLQYVKDMKVVRGMGQSLRPPCCTV